MSSIKFDQLKLNDLLITAKGTVQQTGTTTTAVSLNAPCGVVSTVSETLGAGNALSFKFNNQYIKSDSVVMTNIQEYSGTIGTNGYPMAFVDKVAAGNCTLALYNAHPSNALSGNVGISFLIV